MTSTAHRFIYFAYGSNMSPRRLQARTPSARAIGPASVSGYRLVFDKHGADGSAKADCEHTGRPADQVQGALFQIELLERPALDAAEGAGKGYDVHCIKVLGPRGSVQALTYLATDKRPGLLPFGWYLRHVLEGARAFGLPADYTAAIARWPTLADLDPAREARELAIYAEPAGASQFATSADPTTSGTMPAKP